MDIFFVITDPTRRKMIDMLAGGPLSAGAFVAAFSNVSQPAVSQHLKVLRDSGVVSVSAQQQRRIYALKAGAMKDVCGWVAQHTPPAPSQNTPAPRTRARPVPKTVAQPVEPSPMLDLFG